MPQHEHPSQPATPRRRSLTGRTPDGHAGIAVPIEESAETIARNHAAELAGISARYAGATITVSGDWKTWRADHGGCVHETHGDRSTSGMGALDRELRRCYGGRP